MTRSALLFCSVSCAICAAFELGCSNGDGSGSGGDARDASAPYSSALCATDFSSLQGTQVAPLDCVTGPRVVTVTGDPGAPIYATDRVIDEGDWTGAVGELNGDLLIEASVNGPDGQFSIEFGPDGTSLTPGQLYETSAANLFGVYIYLINDGSGCLANGRFVVFEHQAMGEQIRCLTATFEYLCDASGTGVRGCIHAEDVPLAP